MKNDFEQSSVTVEKLQKKTNRLLYCFLFAMLLIAVLFIASVIPVSELPTLLSVDPQSITLEAPGRFAGAFTSITSVFENSFIFKIFAALLVMFGFINGVLRGNLMIGVWSIFVGVIIASTPIILSTMIGDDSSHWETNKNDKIDFEEYIKKGNSKGYLEALSISTRGEFIINSVLESNVANQDDASNLIDVFSKADAQRISVGLSQAMAIEGQLTGKTSMGLPVSAALAAYVIEAAGGITDHTVIDERTGYAIFAEANKLPGFDKPNPYADEINAQIESSKSRHQLISNWMAVLTGIAIVLLFILVTSYRNVQRAKNVIREEERMRDSSLVQ